MSAAWVTILALAIGTWGAKAVGTLALGHRELSPRTLAVTALLAPALLAGLLVFETFADDDGGITVDARAAGLGAAVVAILLKAPMWVVVLLAAGVAAALRAFT